jgi:hypothetical protein
MVELRKVDSNRVLVTDLGDRKRQYRLGSCEGQLTTVEDRGGLWRTVNNSGG